MNTGRTKIVKALTDKLKLIDGTGDYRTNVFDNVSPKLKFWDEVEDFPFICASAGSESREYLPSNFKWGFLTINLRLYVQGEESEQLLEDLMADVEKVLDENNELEYGPGKHTEDIRIISIDTDEGLMAPYGIAEMVITVRYEIT